MAIKDTAGLKKKLLATFFKNGRLQINATNVRSFINDLVDSQFNRVDDSDTGGVNADWNATSGPAQILNKPSTFPPEAHTHIISSITGLQASLDQKGELGGVGTEGDTLKKLYDLIISGFSEITVPNMAARDAYNITKLPTNIFVEDDGDGHWASYKAITLGVGATFVKLSDPDLLNAVQTAAQIKAAYESNPDTNAFTDALKAIINSVPTLRILGRISGGSGAAEHLTGTQLTTLIDVFTSGLKGMVPASGGGSRKYLRADGTWHIPVIDQPFKLNLTTSNHTGTLTETILWSAFIPAGTFEQNDTLEFYARVTANNNVNQKTFRAYFNTSVAIPSSANRFGMVSATTSSQGFSSFHRNIMFKDSLSVQEVAATSTSYLTDYNVNTNNLNSLAIDFSVDQYIIITGELAVITDTMAIRGVNSKILR